MSDQAANPAIGCARCGAVAGAAHTDGCFADLIAQLRELKWGPYPVGGPFPIPDPVICPLCFALVPQGLLETGTGTVRATELHIDWHEVNGR